jgi:hypothetical protein
VVSLTGSLLVRNMLYKRFAGSLFYADGLTNVRMPAADEVVMPASERDLDDLLEVARAVHSVEARNASQFCQRFTRGDKCFLLRKGSRPAAYIWVAFKSFYIHELRMRLELARGHCYFFDETTKPEFRRQGMLGKTLGVAWDDIKVKSACLCVASDNEPSLLANHRLGFRPFAICRYRQVGPLRYHRVLLAGQSRPRHYLSRASIRPNPVILVCEVGASAFQFYQERRPVGASPPQEDKGGAGRHVLDRLFSTEDSGRQCKRFVKP